MGSTNDTASFFFSLREGARSQKVGRTYYFVVRTFTQRESELMDNHVKSGKLKELIFTDTGDVMLGDLNVTNPIVTDDVRASGGYSLEAVKFANPVFTWSNTKIISPNHKYLLVRADDVWKVCLNHFHSESFKDAVRSATSAGKNKPWGLTFGSGGTKNLRKAFEDHCTSMRIPGPNDGEESYLDVTCNAALSSKQCTESAMFQENLTDHSLRPSHKKQIEKGALMLSVLSANKPPTCLCMGKPYSFAREMISNSSFIHDFLKDRNCDVDLVKVDCGIHLTAESGDIMVDQSMLENNCGVDMSEVDTKEIDRVNQMAREVTAKNDAEYAANEMEEFSLDAEGKAVEAEDIAIKAEESAAGAVEASTLDIASMHDTMANTGLKSAQACLSYLDALEPQISERKGEVDTKAQVANGRADEAVQMAEQVMERVASSRNRILEAIARVEDAVQITEESLIRIDEIEAKKGAEHAASEAEQLALDAEGAAQEAEEIARKAEENATVAAEASALDVVTLQDTMVKTHLKNAQKCLSHLDPLEVNVANSKKKVDARAKSANGRAEEAVQMASEAMNRVTSSRKRVLAAIARVESAVQKTEEAVTRVKESSISWDNIWSMFTTPHSATATPDPVSPETHSASMTDLLKSPTGLLVLGGMSAAVAFGVMMIRSRSVRDSSSVKLYANKR